MKTLKDMSWPHFKPKENLYATRSNPSLKASATVYLQPERVNGSDPSFRRSSEGIYGSGEPGDELQGYRAVPLTIEGLAKIISGPPSADNRLPSSTLKNIPMTDESSLKHKLTGATGMPAIPVVPLVEAPCLLGVSPMLVMPGLPVDATGLASVSVTPPSNLSKKQKLKVKGQKAIRKGRRIVMRKSVMTVLLGRQLAGLTVNRLKIISISGKGAVDVTNIANSVAPVPIPK